MSACLSVELLRVHLPRMKNISTHDSCSALLGRVYCARQFRQELTQLADRKVVYSVQTVPEKSEYQMLFFVSVLNWYRSIGSCDNPCSYQCVQEGAA